MTNFQVRSMIRMALIIFGVAVAYFATGRFLFVLGAPPNGAVTTVWLPSGISVATLVLFGPCAAIGSFLGSVTLELKNDVPLPAGFIVGLANAGSELLCYFLIVRGGRIFSIAARRDVLRFVVAALLGALFSAVVGVSSYVLFAVVPASLFWSIWLTWFGSAAIGVVLITPFLVYSVRERPDLGSRARYLEYVATLVVLASAAFLWQEPAFTNHGDDPVILAVILVFLWIAFRFPPAAMTLAVFSFSIAAVCGAVYHLSQAPPEGEFASIFVLQLMLGGLAMIGYMIDSIVTDQKRTTDALQAGIIERTEAENQARRQQELTAQIIETIPVRVFWKDRDLCYLGGNTLFANDAGLSRPDELIGKTDFEMGWKDQAELYRADDQRVMDATTPKLGYDEPQTTPEGGRIWLRTSKVPLRNAARQVIGILGIYEDITSYKEMELRLLESEERFRQAFQNSAIGMALVGLDGRWMKVNRSLCAIVGYTEEELLEKTFQDITHPDDLQTDVDYVMRLLAGEIEHYQMEKRYFHKDGQAIWVRLSVSLIRGVQGNPIHFVSQMEDVTERKLAEKMLTSSNQRFETVLQAIPDLMFEVDRNGRYLNVWGIRGDYLAASENQLLGRTVEEMLPVAAAQEVLAAIAEADEKGLSFERQIKLPLPQGDFWFELSVAKQPSDPTQESSFIILSRDVTERKQVEDEIRKLNDELESKVLERTQQLLAAQEELVLKEKLAILGQLSGSVGHELRNPLGVMSNAVYFLKMVLADADETTKEYLDIIKKEINNSLRIITDLLDFARTRTPQTKPVTVRELTDASIGRCVIPENIDLQAEIPDNIPLLRVDPLQMGQVLINFITNAVQAMPEGGALRVAARFVGAIHELPLQKQKTGDFIAISITDTGAGVTPENMNKLFQPLFTTKAKGIGLGLVVCKNLVTANNGQIEVESTLGQGTCFTMKLPVAEVKGSGRG